MKATSFSILVLCAAGTLYLFSCASVKSNNDAKLTVPEIIEMTKAGVSDDEIIDKIQQSGTVYKLNGNQYANLKQIGVSDSVINSMQETYTDAVERSEDRDEDWESWNLDDAGY